MYHVYLEKIYKIYIFCGMWSDRPVNCFSSDDSGKYRSKAKQQETLMWWPLTPLIDEKNCTLHIWSVHICITAKKNTEMELIKHNTHSMKYKNPTEILAWRSHPPLIDSNFPRPHSNKNWLMMGTWHYISANNLLNWSNEHSTRILKMPSIKQHWR